MDNGSNNKSILNESYPPEEIFAAEILQRKIVPPPYTKLSDIESVYGAPSRTEELNEDSKKYIDGRRYTKTIDINLDSCNCGLYIYADGEYCIFASLYHTNIMKTPDYFRGNWDIALKNQKKLYSLYKKSIDKASWNNINF